MRYISLLVTALLVAYSLCIQPAMAADFHPALSLQGYTGLLNIPSAAVTEEGALYGLFSNQTESKWRAKTSRQDNYNFSLGMFSHLEIGGRVVEAPEVARDLSANAKVIIPFIPRGEYIPAFAVGIQDMGGGARNLQARYIVSSVDMWRFRLSGGYGFGPDRLKGGFGGVEFKAHDWVYLLGEYDTRETNLGVRLVSPQLFQMPMHLQATLKTTLDYRPERPEFSVGIQIPLGSVRKKVISAPAEQQPGEIEKSAPVALDKSGPGGTATRPLAPEPAATAELLQNLSPALSILEQRLVKIGFQNVRLGLKGSACLLVEFENSLFPRNDLDAVGVVAGQALAVLPKEVVLLELALRKANIVTAVITMPVDILRDYLADARHEDRLRKSLVVRGEIQNEEALVYRGDAVNTTPFTARLELYPGLSTYLATEVGVFDYVLSIKPDLFVNLWKGAVGEFRADIPVSWSKNFENGRVYRPYRENARIDRVMLHQTLKLPGSVMARVGAGMIIADTYGTANEVIWAPGKGSHRFQLLQAKATKEKDGSKNTIDSFTAGYRYFFAPFDTSLRVDGGRFWNRDTGFNLELRRFFGDVEVSVYYKNSELPDHGGNVQAGGMTFAFPLTFRKEIIRPPVQVSGVNEWRYSQQSLIVKPGETNDVNVNTGIRPELSYNLTRIFANRDRLSEAYVEKHLDRIRDAYITYQNP